MSKQNIGILPLTMIAAGVIAAYRAVGYDGNQASVQGQKVQGVARQPAAAAGNAITVDCAGTAVVETGGVFAVGDTLIVDNTGRAIKTTSALKIAAGGVAVTSVAANGAADLAGSDLPEYAFADALEASAGAGAFVEVLLRR